MTNAFPVPHRRKSKMARLGLGHRAQGASRGRRARPVGRRPPRHPTLTEPVVLRGWGEVKGSPAGCVRSLVNVRLGLSSTDTHLWSHGL